jgi:hypothetical protein
MEQTIEEVGTESSEEFWKGHIVAASKFDGSNTLYCRANGLNHKTFSTYKVKLGFSKPKGRPKAFVEVKPKVEEKRLVRADSKKSLPDAKWLAEFAITLLTGQLK